MNSSADLLKELRIDRSTPPPASSRRGRWLLLAVLVVLIVSAGAAWALFFRTKPVDVQTAVAAPLASSGAGSTSVLDATGYVVARRMATVSAKVTGKVREVLIEEGQHVSEGQVLATLDPIDANADRDLARAQLAAARSQSGSVQAQLRQADADAARLASLVKQQLVSKSQYDQAVAQRDALRAQLATTQRNTQVASDQLRIAGNGVDNTVVRAPFAGVVIAKAAQPGEIVSPFSAGGGFTRTGIGTIVDMDSLEVEVDVNEAYIGRVQPKMPVEAVLNAYPDWQIPAEVIAIIPTADRSKATVKVRVALHAHDARIVPDMGVRVSFLETEKPTGRNASPPPGVLVPGAAVVTRDGNDSAFVAADNHARLVRVQAADVRGEQRVVTSGLSIGDVVIVSPPATLNDGDPIQIK